MPQIKKIDCQSEKPLLLQHLLLLDPESRQQRFNYALNDAAIENYVRNIPPGDICVGVVVPDLVLAQQQKFSQNPTAVFDWEKLVLDQQSVPGPNHLMAAERSGLLNPEVCVGFLHIGVQNKVAELGVSVLKKYQGYNLASAMVVMGLFLLEERPDAREIEEVVMYCDPQNTASIKLGKKFGLKVIVEGFGHNYEIAQTKEFKNVQFLIKNRLKPPAL